MTASGWTDVSDVFDTPSPAHELLRAADSLDVSYVRRHAHCTAQAACQPADVFDDDPALHALGRWVRAQARPVSHVARSRAADQPWTVDVLTGAVNPTWLAAVDDRDLGAEWRRQAHDAALRGHVFSE